MRLFISVNFDEKTKQNIAAVQRRLKKFGHGRFSREENFHLTLAFLGEVPEERVADVKAAMSRVTVPEALLPEPFSAHVGSIHLMLSHRPDGKLTYTEL